MNQEVPISLLPAGQMLNYANGGYSIGMTGERGFLPGSGGDYLAELHSAHDFSRATLLLGIAACSSRQYLFLGRSVVESL